MSYTPSSSLKLDMGRSRLEYKSNDKSRYPDADAAEICSALFQSKVIIPCTVLGAATGGAIGSAGGPLGTTIGIFVGGGVGFGVGVALSVALESSK